MSRKKSLIIVGGGGLCREVIWLAGECFDPGDPSADWRVKGVLDDTPEKQGQSYCNVPVIGTIMDWEKFQDCYFVVAIGSPRGRRSVVERMLSQGDVNFATLVHRSVRKSEFVTIGGGSIVTAGCILTTQITFGMHTICNLASTIGHDVVTGDYCTLAPHVAVSGNVTIGDGVEVGTGAIIIEKLKLGKGCFVGAGAVVSKDLPEDTLAVGCPARSIKTLPAF